MRKILRCCAIFALAAGLCAMPCAAEGLELTSEIYGGIGLPTSGEVVIPETVTYQGEEFTVTSIGAGLFENCDGITEIILPDTVTSIGSLAFNGCSGLKSIYMPGSVEYIGMGAFQLCSSLEFIELPEGLKTLGNFAYNHCSGVKNKSIYIGSELEHCGVVGAPAHMFYDCGTDGSFTRFVVDMGNGSYQANDGILYTKDGSWLIAIPRGKAFVDGVYHMPDSVEHLGELSFSRNQNITAVEISDNLIINSELTSLEKISYNNYGNPLSRAVYVYCPVAQYIAKETNPNYISIDGVLYTKDCSTLVAVPNSYNQPLVIPDGVTSWQKEAMWSDALTKPEYFDGLLLSSIPSISIPASLTDIDFLQVDVINCLHDKYGTEIYVDSSNPWYYVDGDGHLATKISIISWQ